MDQIDGLEPPGDTWDAVDLGEEVDTHGDPPRLWSRKGSYPGTAFTRSIGDHQAEKIGCIAEPEVTVTEIQATHRWLVVASDGMQSGGSDTGYISYLMER